MIELRGVAKRFGELQVLDGVDLRAEPGRVMALVGPNSAGKTTLIKSILGLTRLDAGTIRVCDAAVDPSDGERSRSKIGYMPQIARFPENLTGADLFAMLRDLRGSAGEDDSLVDALQLRPMLDKPMRVLSGGTRQKVNACLAFLFRPEVLILDEPTAGLDPLASSILKDRVLAERGRGRTVIVTSHVMSELDELADDVAFLLEGRVRFIGTVRDLKDLTHQRSLERALARAVYREMAA